MKTNYLGQVTDTAMSFIPGEKNKPSRVGVYMGVKKGGRKALELVKAGPHVDAEKAANIYIHQVVKRTGQTVRFRYYDIKEVTVYHRINHALYHKLILQYSRMRMRDTAAFGLPAEQAMLTDADIAKVLEFSRGELLSRNGLYIYA